MYDLGPSLGSINRSVLIGCQHFLTPLGSDVFSIIGVKNIATWLSKWLKDYINLWNLLEPEEKTILRDRFNIIDTLVYIKVSSVTLFNFILQNPTVKKDVLQRHTNLL